MLDHEHQELESRIHSLERKIDDLDYDLRYMKRDLEADIHRKADTDHSHGEGL